MKKGSHKNQIIITTLALLLAVVGYISYDNRDTFMNAKDVLSTEIEAVNGKADTKEPEECEDTQASDEKYILCTIIKKNGSAPRGVGTQMLVSSDNRIIGTIGGGCAEAEVISHCRRLFRKQVFKCGLMDVSMNTDDAEKEGMVCGGSISVLLEQIG